MKKRVFTIAMILLVIVSASAFAASSFGFGVVNYYADFFAEDNDYSSYIPGIRGEFFLSDFLGISADAMILYADDAFDNALLLYMVNAVGRIPLGLVEPYVAVGPTYLGAIINGEPFVDDSSFGFNVRGGADFNILSWLSLGIEANFFVDDLGEFFENIGDYLTENALKNSLIGITAKIKF